jgi:hypothetical protein
MGFRELWAETQKGTYPKLTYPDLCWESNYVITEGMTTDGISEIFF